MATSSAWSRCDRDACARRDASHQPAEVSIRQANATVGARGTQVTSEFCHAVDRDLTGAALELLQRGRMGAQCERIGTACGTWRHAHALLDKERSVGRRSRRSADDRRHRSCESAAVIHEHVTARCMHDDFPIDSCGRSASLPYPTPTSVRAARQHDVQQPNAIRHSGSPADGERSAHAGDRPPGSDGADWRQRLPATRDELLWLRQESDFLAGRCSGPILRAPRSRVRVA